MPPDHEIQRFSEIQSLIETGRIRLGMTRDDLYDVMGNPDDKGATSRKYPEPADWKYGDVDLLFPAAKSPRHAQAQGLFMVYVEMWDHDEPIFLLRPDNP